MKILSSNPPEKAKMVLKFGGGDGAMPESRPETPLSSRILQEWWGLLYHSGC